MTWMMLVTLIGCRTEDEKAGTDTQDTQDTGELTEIGDVDAMAVAWCDVLACRTGFDGEFPTIEDCVEFYGNYWGNPAWDNNQRECFEDIEDVAACTAALEVTECGGETPLECTDFMVCDDPDDTE
ncbi:MAG: hypothetical protein ACI8RZ_005958 [Myxococcota bacterium]|jgi:hypothetical protein